MITKKKLTTMVFKNHFSKFHILLAMFLSIGVWGQILTFDFAGLGGNEASASSNFNNTNLGSSTITRGAGLSASANGDRFNATNWALTSIANAVTGNNYMQFTITPNSGYQFDVSSIVFQIQRSNTGFTGIALRSSVDGYTTNLDAVKSVVDNTATQTFTFTFAQANSSTAVTYRLYGYAEATSGSGGPGDGTGNDIVVNGTVTSVVADTTPPALASLIPNDNATNVAINTNLQITLDENVKKGTGNFLIKNSSDGSTVQTIDVASSAVTVSGTTVTIDPADLANSTGYYIEFASGVIQDIAGNNFAGISGATTWNFTTAAPSAPVITSTLTKSNIYGTADTYTITASNTPTSYSTGTLPSGFSFAGSVITKANNVEAGIYNISISATNAGGTDTKTLVWTVSAKPLTINGLTGANKVYDGNTTATISGSPGLVGVVFSDDVSVTGVPTVNFTTKDVGTNKAITITGYTLTGAKSGNYSVSQPSGLTANVSAKSLTLTSAVASNKVYDGTNAATITGTLSGIISPDVVTLIGTGTFASVNAGNGIAVNSTSTLGGADAGNYTLIQPTGLVANITKADQTITFTAIPTLGVGNTYNLTLVASSTSGLTLSFASASTGVASVSGSLLTGVSVGTSLITASQSGNGNYNPATSASQTVTVALEAFEDGDFRTKSAGVWNNKNDAASTATWQKYSLTTNTWNDSSTSPSALDTNVYIAHNIEIPVSTTINGNFKIIVKDGATLTYKSSSGWTFRNIIIKSGGVFDMQTLFTVLSSGHFEIEDGGNFWFNYTANSAATLTSNLWAGDEIFHPNSNFIIKNHESGSGKYFLPPPANISANTYNGVTAYFGNLISESSGGEVRFTTTNFNNTTLTHGNLEIKPNGSYTLVYGNVNWTIGKDFIIRQNAVNLTASPNLTGVGNFTITFNVKGNFINNSKSNFRLSNATSGTATLNIDGNMELRDEGKFDAKFGSTSTTEVNLKGDLLVDENALLRTTNLTTFNFTGIGDGLTAATTQNIDVATTITNENSNLNFNVKSGAYVQLLNRNFELGTNSKLTAESGSSLDFGFTGNTALNVTRVASTAGQSFASDAGSLLKITSPDGISNGTSVYTGNVQVGATSANRVFNPAGTFHFIGKANAAQVLANGADQISGNGLPSDTSAKIIIVELNTANVAQDDVSFKAIGVNKFSSAGYLKIIKGTVIDVSGNGFADGTAEDGKLIMTGGRYKISRGGTQPSLGGDYELTGGVIEFAGSSSVQIRTGSPAKQYLNIDVSGTNVEAGGKNLIVNNLLKITDPAAVFTVPEVALDSDNPYVVTAKKGIQIVSGGKALFKNNAVLLQDKDAANSGNITMERKATVPSLQYNYWSSPVKEQSLYSLYNVPNNTVMVYNSANDKFTILPTSANPKSVFAKGYSIKGSPTVAPALTAIFVGEPNNESTTGVNTIALSTAGNNYNLIGNPYPSNLDMVALFNDTDNFSKFYNGPDETPTAYLWDNTSNTNLSQVGSGYVNQNYAIVNLSSGVGIPAPIVGATGKKPNGIIRPGQGFIMRAAETGGSITFKNALMRTSGITMGGTNSQHFKNGIENNDRFYLKLTTPKDMNIVTALLYNPEAENSFERFDSTIFSESVTENFYSLSSDSKKLAIQGRKGSFNIDDIIPLGIKTSTSGSQKISIEAKDGIFNGSQNIYLKDKLLNQIINLTNGDYVFQSGNGTDLSRFEIVFKEDAVLGTSSVAKSDFEIYRDGTDYVINSSKVLGKIEIYDAAGRLVISQKSSAKNFRLDSTILSNGVFIIKVENSGDVRTRKIIK